MKAGWEVKPLGELTETATGNTPPKSAKENYGTYLRFVKPPELFDGLVFETADGLSELGAGKARIAPKGSVLVSCIGNLGKVGLLTEDAAYNQQINAVKPNPSVFLPEYFFYFCLSDDFKEQLASVAGGTTVPIVNKSRFNSLTIPIPPLAEQKQIVAVLDAAFEGLSRAKDNAEANLQNARELFESGLDEAFLETDGKMLRLDEICRIGDGNHSGNYPKKSEMVPEGVPFIRSSNLQNGQVQTTDILYITDEKHQILKKGHLIEGDVLFSNRGEIGKLGIVPPALDGSNLNSQVAWLRCNDNVNNLFLFYYLQSGRMKAHYLDTQSGAALQQFTIKMLKAVLVPVPEIEVQRITVEKLLGIDEHSTFLQDCYRTKLTDIADLRQSLLQKAFAGALTCG